MYTDNKNGLKRGPVVYTEVYENMDRTGVHLNKKGKMILEDNMKNALHETYFKVKLRKE